MKNFSIKTWLLLLTVMFFGNACREFVEVPVPDLSLTTESVFSDEQTAESALLNVYARMSEGWSDNNLPWFSKLSADEFINYYTDYRLEFFNNEIEPNNAWLLTEWSRLYDYIYTLNAVLEGVNAHGSLPDGAKNSLMGEARFLRAFIYLHLVSFWGDVPLVTTTGYDVNSQLSRTPVKEVYDLIIDDLLLARSMLPANGTDDRIRPDVTAASALLARCYLYNQDWQEAEREATGVIGHHSYVLEDDLNQVFVKNSREVIWQIHSVIPYINTWDGYLFILQRAPRNLSLDDAFVDDGFESGDHRKLHWIGNFDDAGTTFYFPFKYKVRMAATAETAPVEHQVYLRLAEQYLIRAEARAHQNDLEGAVDDLDKVRQRAGLQSIADVRVITTKEQLLDAVEQERKVELFSEWCHRWFDLTRTGRADAVLGTVKPNWRATDILYPIPQYEIERNDNLVQNPGY